VPYLSDKEIACLLDLLEQYDASGTLKGQPRAIQEEAFRKRAGRQLLVALHEATLGKPFEEIVKDEYDAIMPHTAQSMYLTICVLNRMTTPVRAGLISRVHGITFERFEADFFKPLEHVVFARLGRRHYDYEYRARHPHVAELVFRQVLVDPGARFERYMTILSALNISYETDRTSFAQMINARKVMDLFSDHMLIDHVYDAALELAPEEGNVFLQRGIYEMRRSSGSLDRAAECFEAAHDRMPHSRFVQHSYAELELRRAEEAENKLVRETHLKKARALIAPLLKAAKDAYSFHTAFKIEKLRLSVLLSDASDAAEDETITDVIRNAESILSDGLQRFPSESYLHGAEAELAELLSDKGRAIKALEKAVAGGAASPYVVSRLAQVYRGAGDHDRARELLEREVERRPYERRLHYLLAQILLEQAADGILIESHLRKSYSDGDQSYEAQFWYARQLYINGKEADAQKRFQTFSDQRMSPEMRHDIRGPWRDGDKPRRFGGHV